eukprot:12334688-Heterocapsa_arctica.AAC.1
MEIVCYVVKRTRELTTCGGTALRSASIQISVVAKYWTSLPLSEHMKAEDQCHECKGKAKSVCIGSSYKIGASNYSGWGLWSPADQSFNDNGPLK